MLRALSVASILVFCVLALALPAAYQQMTTVAPPNNTYLGFDLNEYPGDAALPTLRKTFSFSNFWLGPPPGEKKTNWTGKRAALKAQGFGFVVLFTGRDSHNLKNAQDAQQKGILDADNAAKSAEREGFAKGTIIFLDIEEGGRLLASYHQYILSWLEDLRRRSFRAGVYCSAVPVNEGKGVTITTAQDIHDHIGAREIAFWVYNDVCPPSPGCTFQTHLPPPSQSGFPAAQIWQYAQSPRRKERTAQCPANYAPDGNCYVPGDSAHKWFLDANVASSPDPSSKK